MSDADFYAAYTYLADGRLYSEELANGAEVRNHFYNSPGWLLRIDGDRFTEDITHTTGWTGPGYYDGRIKTTSFTYNWTGKPADYAVQYTYDDLGQLTVAENDLNTAWNIGVGNPINYDANGNILDLMRGSTTKNYTYYAGTNKVQNLDGSGNDYGYDANANVTRSDPKAIPTITYDSFTQRPTSVSMSSGASMSLQYGGDTQRVLKNYTSGTSTNSRLYLHGANDYPLIEKNKTLATAETLAVYIYGLNGAIAKRVGSTVLFLLKDHLGSTRVVMDGTGLVRTYYDYDALGNIIRIGTTNEVKYQFTGQEYDESGVHNYRARLYDSDLGKFYAVDPAGQGWAPFAYAGNNPVIYVDKDGNFWFLVAAVAIAGGLNVYQNWDQIQNFGDALGYFGLGAASGALSTTGPVGWFLGGAITSAGNTALGGGGFGSIVQNGFIGGFSGLAGGYGGQVGSKLGGVVINGTSINSPFLSGLIGGGLGGAGGGFAGGFTGSLLTGGSFNNALTAGLSGARSGFAAGAPIGAGAASVQARRAGLDPLTGKPSNQPIQPATRTESSLKLVTDGDELQYNDRIAGQTDLYHDFPRLLDREIIEYGAPSLRISDRAYWFELPGSINRVEGIYQIGMNQNNVIFHRNFLPLHKYGLQFRLRK